jgi:tRNA-specific 2-thiouridylase
MKIIVGMSGGVDSTIAALLLKEQGHEVTGVTMKVYSGGPSLTRQTNACYSPDEDADIEYTEQVAHSLGIRLHVFDLKDAYRSNVLDYVSDEYCSGRTPNPCVRCNQHLKFNLLVEAARTSGLSFDCFATGHYARVEYCAETGRHLLKKAIDKKRDQSYFLCMLSQKQLQRILFPLGEYTKPTVREIARKHQLINCSRADSQDFAAGSYRHLLQKDSSSGYIKDKNETILGSHSGIWDYTIGQRKGLGIARGKPLYVTAIDYESNTVYVGDEGELLKKELIARDANWVSIASLTRPMQVTAKIRSSHPDASAVISPENKGTIRVAFSEPQKSLTPGQMVVFYDEDVLVGGAVIDQVVET